VASVSRGPNLLPADLPIPVVERLRLPFPLLSDVDHVLAGPAAR